GGRAASDERIAGETPAPQVPGLQPPRKDPPPRVKDLPRLLPEASLVALTAGGLQRSRRGVRPFPERRVAAARRLGGRARRMVRLCGLVCALAALFGAAAQGQIAPGHYQEFGDARGFLNIVPPGQDGSLN